MPEDAPSSSSSLNIDQQESLDLYAAQLKHKAVTPRDWLKTHPDASNSEAFREQLWCHYSLVYPPPKVPGFTLLDVLGEGGMGKVYLGTDKLLQRLVAIKELTAELKRDPAFRERFRLEAQFLAKLKHPHIVEVHQFLAHDGREFMVMEHVDQGSLTDRLIPGRPEPPQVAVRWLIKLAKAIGHAHEEQIIHRDLKPGNILFDKRGEPRVSDFGLAKNLLDPTDRTHGAAVGTARYMAPEQTDGKPPVPGTDIWALGVILFQLLTGRLPFGGATQKELFNNICNEEPAPMGDSVDPILQSICLKCLAKVPEHRYLHAADLARALEANVSGDDTVSIVRTRDRRGGRRSMLLWIGIPATLLVLAIALVIGWIIRPGPQRMNALHTGLCTSIVFAPDGQRAYSESGTTDIFVWDVTHAIKEDVISHGIVDKPFEDDAGLIAISPDGKWLAAESKTLFRQSTLVLINLSTKKKDPRLKWNTSLAPGFTFSPDSALLYSMEYQPELFGLRKPNTALKTHDIGNNQDATSTTFESRGLCMAFEPERRTLAIGCDDGIIRLCNLDNKKVEGLIPGHGAAIDQIVYANDGRRIFSASSADRSLRQWTLDPTKERSRIALDKTPTCNAFWKGGRAITGHVDGDVCLWDMETGKRVYRYHHANTKVTAVAISPNGQKALVALSDRSVYVHNLPTNAGE